MRIKQVVTLSLLFVVLLYIYQTISFGIASLFNNLFFEPDTNAVKELLFVIAPIRIVALSILFVQITVFNTGILMLLFFAHIKYKLFSKPILINIAVFLLLLLVVFPLNVMLADLSIPDDKQLISFYDFPLNSDEVFGFATTILGSLFFMLFLIPWFYIIRSRQVKMITTNH